MSTDTDLVARVITAPRKRQRPVGLGLHHQGRGHADDQHRGAASRNRPPRQSRCPRSGRRLAPREPNFTRVGRTRAVPRSPSPGRLHPRRRTRNSVSFSKTQPVYLGFGPRYASDWTSPCKPGAASRRPQQAHRPAVAVLALKPVDARHTLRDPQRVGFHQGAGLRALVLAGFPADLGEPDRHVRPAPDFCCASIFRRVGTMLMNSASHPSDSTTPSVS